MKINDFKAAVDATAAAHEPIPEVPGVTYYRDTETTPHYLVIRFDEQPDEDTRKFIRKSGWSWSPARNAWKRPITLNGLTSARTVMAELKERLRR
jgi:hypothetical protein